MKTIDIHPISKPRMTRADRWKKRKCVVLYWQWKDRFSALVRDAFGVLPKDPEIVSWTAFFQFPKSWSKKKREQHMGKPHRNKPDRDNVDKAILDSLFQDDSCIYAGKLVKLWDDGKGPRIELEIF